MSAATITNKTVVVTGGSRGIGLGLVQRFLQRDNTVVATTRSSAGAEALQRLRQQYGERVRITELDTSQPESVARWAEALAAGGLGHVDVLVNNAGVYGRRLGLLELEASDFALPFATNAVGPFLVVQQLAARRLLGPPGSLVVNMSSIMSSHGDQAVSSTAGGGYAYRASKSALNIITKALTLDLAEQQVQCVLMHPGYVKTDMTGGSGWVDVDESTDGILKVLESGQPLNGRFFGYNGEEIPW